MSVEIDRLLSKFRGTHGGGVSVGDVVEGECSLRGRFIGRVWAMGSGLTEIRRDDGMFVFVSKSTPLAVVEKWEPPSEVLNASGSYVEIVFSKMDPT